MKRCRCRQCMGTDEPEEMEYCEDGRCGACPGCLRAQDEEEDQEYERKRDKNLEREGI